MARIVRGMISAGEEAGAPMMAMFDPPVSTDPYARRLFQKPSPPFVIKAAGLPDQFFDIGDTLSLQVLFIGDPVKHVTLFSLLLHALGRSGLWRGEGKFDLVNMYGTDSSKNRVMLPIPSVFSDQFAIPQIGLDWLIDIPLSYESGLRLEFMTPARLMSAKKPLFKVDFATLFPFMLRRVTSMLNTWGGFELIDDAQDLIAVATQQVDVVESGLHWEDWRTLSGGNGGLDLGGVIGKIILDRVGADDVVRVIRLAELFNLGKSAAYGCGQFMVAPVV